MDESDVRRHLGNDPAKPSNLRNLCGAAIRLRNFIRRRVPDPRDAEDILQDAFYKLVEANRLLMPIDQVTSWLFRVARNRITDLFRKKKETFSHASVADQDDEFLQIEDLLPSPDAGPEAFYSRRCSAGARSPSGKRSGCWRFAGFCSAAGAALEAEKGKCAIA